MARPTTVAVDIDGVIATGTRETVYSSEAGWAYERCAPLMEGIIMVRKLFESGAKIVLYTARWEKDRGKTEVWLRQYGVPYHELRMDKPSAELYIDDRAFRYDEALLGQTDAVFEALAAARKKYRTDAQGD